MTTKFFYKEIIIYLFFSVNLALGMLASGQVCIRIKSKIIFLQLNHRRSDRLISLCYSCPSSLYVLGSWMLMFMVLQYQR